MRHLDWPGLCAFVLSLGVAASLVVAITGNALSDHSLTPVGAQLLGTIFGASIGAIATYMGLARQQQQQDMRTRRNDEAPERQEPER